MFNHNFKFWLVLDKNISSSRQENYLKLFSKLSNTFRLLFPQSATINWPLLLDAIPLGWWKHRDDFFFGFFGWSVIGACVATGPIGRSDFLYCGSSVWPLHREMGWWSTEHLIDWLITAGSDVSCRLAVMWLVAYALEKRMSSVTAQQKQLQSLLHSTFLSS